MRLNSDHHDVILNLAEKHPQIITNKFKGALGNNLSKSIWQQLTNQLNGLGYGVLNENEYKRRLIDWKSKTKAKAAEIDRSKRCTGGGQSTVTILTQHEERLLSLMGKSAVRGNEGIEEFGVEVMGLQFLPEKNKQVYGKVNLTKSHVSVEATPSNVSQEIISQASTSATSNWEAYTVSPTTFEIEDFVPSVESDVEMTVCDHSYTSAGQPNSSITGKQYNNITEIKENRKSVSTNRRRRISDMTSEIKNMNDETLSILKSMDTNLGNINCNLSAINNTLINMSESLLKIIKDQ